MGLRTFIYSLLTRGRPFPVMLFLRAIVFCIGNGFLQAYYLIYCAEYPKEWYTDVRFSLGVFLFILGMGINIHSDYLLRQLRKPGEVIYKIPQGGLFTYVSGANFLGEIIEWMGYALATWSLPAFAFAFFSLCFLGVQAFYHHSSHTLPAPSSVMLLELGERDLEVHFMAEHAAVLHSQRSDLVTAAHCTKKRSRQ
ncbi:steroid 5 alpha-reductase 2 [Cricetulus griseus]